MAKQDTGERTALMQNLILGAPPPQKNPSTCHLYGMQDLIYIPIDTILVYYMDDLLLVCSDKRYL